MDFYRARALSERAAMLTTTGRQIGDAARPAFAVLIVIAMVWALPPARSVPAGEGTIVASASSPIAR
jgi:hypothetical protein